MIIQIKEHNANYRRKDANANEDGLWKNLIFELFKEFMQFFAPDLYPEIDFKMNTDFLQQELHQQIINQKKGTKYTDQIVKVNLKNGKEKYILIHIEIQAIGKDTFTERMFKYFYRIYDKLNHPIYAIARLTDARYKNHTDKFRYSFYGTELTYAFNKYKFHEKDEEKLKQSSNPFSLAVLAGIYSSETKNDIEKRYLFKQKLLTLAINKYSDQEYYLSALIYFIDYLLQIPEELGDKLKYELPE